MPPKARQPVLRAPARQRQPARAGSVSRRVIDTIRELLLKGRIRAGDFLGTESTLLEHFGIGRSPLRDALRTLEALGIVEIRTGLGGGVYVAEGNPDLFAEIMAIQLKLIDVSLDELLEAIWAVEGRAVELAASRITAADLARLQEILDELGQAIGRPAKFVAKSMAFHTAMVEAARSRALTAQARMLHYILFRHYSGIVNRDITSHVYESLNDIRRGLSTGSRTQARRALDAHYQAARRSMIPADPKG